MTRESSGGDAFRCLQASAASYRICHLLMLLLAGAVLHGSVAQARTLSSVFSNELAGLEMEPLGPALANTVAQTYPVASASSSVTYLYDPRTETFERQTRVLGPIIGERAETIGEHQLNASLSYSYVRLNEINGDSLDHLINAPAIDGRFVSFRVPGGVILADGRFTNVLPVMVNADLDVRAHIITPGATYGITPDLDVNLTLPLVHTSLDVDGTSTVPDPRLPQFALAPGNPLAMQTAIPSVDDSAFGVGDLLLRGKYVLFRERPVDLAAGLGVSFPTGNDDNFAGTGTYRVLPTLIVSRVLLERFEPLLNLGVDINADDVDRSVFRWAVGGSMRPIGELTATVLFLGRNEFSRQSDRIDPPFFFQIERNDIYDVSVGLRYLFLGSGVISANFIVPLNDDGLRPNFVPTLQIEYGFSAPW